MSSEILRSWWTVFGSALIVPAFVPSGAADAATLYVPSQYATIQAAIDAAQDGDEVVVMNGVYTGAGNKNLSLGGKAITVRSVSGDPATCIIDCQGSGRGFYFHNGETAASVVDGFTIRNGNNPAGAGVNCSGSGLTLSNCTISGNTGFEGAVYCGTGSPTLTNCTISGNTASGQNCGAGVYCMGSQCSPTFTNCTISGNTGSGSYSGGGVVSVSYAVPTFTNCTIGWNTDTGTYSGGGVWCSYSEATFINCTICGNTGANGGGGLSGCEASPTLISCRLAGNTTSGSYGGSGIFFMCGGSPLLVNCTLSGNRATGSQYSGCVYSTESSPMLINCTFSGNTASGSAYSGCVYAGGGSHSTLTNCVLWGDTPCEMVTVGGGVTTVSYCDIQGGHSGTGNINLNPLFIDPDGPDNDPNTWQDNDYRLVAGSPCIDAGKNSAVPSGIVTDFNGLPRFVDDPATADCRYVPGTCGTAPIVDMGAYEHQVVILQVPSEYATIQAAINAAQPGEQVVVADGVYTGAGNKDLNFAGKAIAVRSASGDPAACIIDCQGGGRGFYFWNGETAASVVDGFTIRNGYAGSSGGVYCNGSSPTVTNCVISGNTSTTGGGGVFCTSHASPTLMNCTISGNTTPSSSSCGGVQAASQSNPTLINCAISGNTGGQAGIYCNGFCSMTLTNCTIRGNTGVNGGGVACYESSPTLVNCEISGNTASGSTGGGGGVFAIWGSNPTLINCTLSGNKAFGAEGSSVWSGGSSIPALTNCILWGNETPHEFYAYSGSLPMANHCNVQGGFGGIGNIDLDPLFVDPDGPDNDPNTWQDNDYRLAGGSPCIDAGKNSAVPSGIVKDLDDHPRFVDDPDTADCPYAPTTCGTAPIVDMGAYEYQGAIPRGDLNCDGFVDVADIAPFVLVLTDPAGYASQYAGCPATRGDMDNSGTVDGADIQWFIDAFLAW
ncbi:MAG TPA: right-handed parallel beta-helix repeat-containing protein [Phycisphaerae bacterium]|nr:right-handed parallel beta-helix repeat-containing protein [Phycisphaerae bacterium]